MKIDKNKHPGDKRGFFFELEEGEKFQEMSALRYKIIKGVLNSHKTKIKNFLISSGKLVLTSVGIDEFCARVMWSFPTGTFDAYIGNDKNADSIFIPFRKFKSETIRYHILLTTFHLNVDDVIPSDMIESQCLQVNGAPLFLMDEAEWTNYNSTVYSKNSKTYEETIEDLNGKVLGKSIIMPFKFDGHSESSEGEGTKSFYFAYSGFTLDGDPAYLWLRKVKRDDIK